MANPTTNFGWQMPTSTDLVTDLPADFEVFGQAVDTSLAELKGGTTGQVLSKASNTDMDFSWVAQDDSNAIQNAIVDAKGDLIAATAADTPARLAVGTNGQVLTADSTAATGLKWATTTTTAGLTLISTASFSAVSSVSLATDSFTSTYDNYKLVINISSLSGSNTYLNARLRAAGSDNTTSNYTSQFLVISQTSTTLTNDHGGAASSAFSRFGYVYSSQPEYIEVDIFNPKATARTAYSGRVNGPTTEGWVNSGLFAATTSFDSFTFYPSAGTITGAYSLYGYNK
jgi:hypothetical protein